MNPNDIYNAYRLKALGENDLINQRMTWFVILQSFLFISAAISSGSENVAPLLPFVFIGIGVVGFFSACLAFFSIGSALNAIRNTKKRWDEEFVIPNHLDNHYRPYPALTGGRTGDKLSATGRWMPRLLPAVVGSFWFCVLCYFLLVALHFVQYPPEAA